MSAKILYTLSDDNNPKQLGCINGFLHQFLSGRAVNGHVVPHHHKRIPPGQPKMGSKDARDEETITKLQEKSLKNNRKEMNMNSAETASMASSCSSASSSFSPSQRYIRASEEQSIQGESSKVSMNSSRKRQVFSNVVKDIDSPRPLQPSNLQNQKPYNSSSTSTTLRGESVSSAQDKKKKPHARRLSYDGRESSKSGLKLNELPRLSLDSRQGRVRSASVSGLKSDFLQQEEPVSSRPVSSVVARLMGLEDILQLTSISTEKQNVSKRSEDLDLFSRSTRSTDESETDSERHSVSIYREIDKRLGDLDFRKSGKDLRALKHILDAIQRTKSKMESSCNDDNRVSETMHGIKNTQYVNLENRNDQKIDDSPSRAAEKGTSKPGKVKLPRVRTSQAAKSNSEGMEKRRAKDSSPKAQPKCGKLEKFSQERMAGSAIRTPSQEPKNPKKAKMQSPRRTIEARNRKVVVQKPELNDQYDLVHTPRPSQLFRKLGPGAKANEEAATILKEQPSPVSVLDADFFDDESLSPIKKKATAFRDDDATPVSARVEWIAVDTNHSSNSTRSIFSSYNTGKTAQTPNDLWLGKEMCEELSPVEGKGPCPRIEDENNFLTNIIAKDLARRSECWTDFSSENSWLVLDIERLLFKDLIVELMHEEASS